MSLPKPYYQDSAVTLYHGDSLAILPLLGQFDLLLTDPPYGILNLQGEGSTTAVRKSPRQRGSGTLKNRLLNQSDVEWDVAPTEEVLNLIRSKARIQIIWGGNYFPLPPCRGVLVWDKEQPWENFSQVELAWTNLPRPAAIFRKSGTSGTPNKEHPTQKPLSLMQWCIQKAGAAETILDPFAGSGTTGLAAKNLGRKVVLIEREEKYCEIAARRMAQEVLAL